MGAPTGLALSVKTGDRGMKSASAFANEAGPSIWNAIPIVFIVDDDISVRESLGSLICSVGWRAETFASAQEFLCRQRVLTPSCLILDVALPDLSGLAVQERVADRNDMSIIFIADCGDVTTTVKAMRAGAVEFLTKPFRDDLMLDAVGHAIERSNAVLIHEARMRTFRERHASLSCREREVMARVVAGLLNKQVAHELGISEITVKAHRGRMMRKMKADSFADLVKIAASLDLAHSPQETVRQLPSHGLPSRAAVLRAQA